MMKKLILVLFISFLCISCNQANKSNDLLIVNEVTKEYDVYIGFNKAKTIEYDDDLYISLDELDILSVNIIVDEDSGKIYLSDSVFPKTVSNERNYSWYIDQGNTGTYSSGNCGPSSSVMAAKWQNEHFEITPEEARSEFRSDGGWWYTDDIEDFFEKHEVSYDLEDYGGSDELQYELSNGNIILICIDTTYLEYADEDDYYTGKFYDYKGGHFIILKGYTYIDYKLYFEVYDSNTWNAYYSDGSPKGKDRLYPANELEEAIENWWDYYIVINKEES